MRDEPIHEGEPRFEDFIEAELKDLAERAGAAGICLDCLTDRLVVELVAGLVRSGASPAEILNLVAEGMEGGEDDEAESGRHSRRMH